jgi:hypothetical protein
MRAPFSSAPQRIALRTDLRYRPCPDWARWRSRRSMHLFRVFLPPLLMRLPQIQILFQFL